MLRRIISGMAWLALLGAAGYFAWTRYHAEAPEPVEAPSFVSTEDGLPKDSGTSAVETGSTIKSGQSTLLAPEPGFYSDVEYAQFKETYYCNLARDTRLKCETLDRGPDGLEQCLKLSQYYTYSRHCGTQP